MLFLYKTKLNEILAYHDMVFLCYSQQLKALDKAYVISIGSKDDIKQLLRALGNIRSLLLVQAGPSEEELMKSSLK